MGPVQRAERSASARDSAGHEGTSAPARRVFLRWRELPRLLLGVLRGDAVAQRRVLGARRGGRLGLLLALAALLLVAPGWLAATGLAALHVALTLACGLAAKARGLGVRQRLRLSLWAATPALLIAAPLRLAVPDSLVPALLSLAAAQLILIRGLRGVSSQSWSDGGA